MLPQEYYANARRLFRIAAARIQQEKDHATKESIANDEPATKQPKEASRKRSNLQKKRNNGKDTGTKTTSVA
jgi:hypothetical protein